MFKSLQEVYEQLYLDDHKLTIVWQSILINMKAMLSLSFLFFFFFFFLGTNYFSTVNINLRKTIQVANLELGSLYIWRGTLDQLWYETKN